MSPTVQLTPEQVAFYHENGYLSLPQISPPEEVAELREIYDRLFAARTGRDTGNQFDLAGADEEGKEESLPQILGPSQYEPRMLETHAWANARVIAQALLGGDGSDIGQGDHAILKPARHGAPTPWHQDEAYWDPNFEHQSFSIWMPLQDTDQAMGCMAFVPGSHRAEIYRHRPIGGDVRVHGLELDEELDLEKAVFVPTPAGGCTIHSQRTLHYAGPNHTDTPRRAWILMASRPGKPRTTPRRFPWQEVQQTARAERASAKTD
jgi:ectoine hydroxylase-related dioxygenase (phytanoyl-CoA dioxygenase family)